MYSIFRRAIEAGGRQTGPFEVEWNLAGNCLFPVRRELSAHRPHRGFTLERWGWQFKAYDDISDTFLTDVLAPKKVRRSFFNDRLGPYAVLMEVRCRMCDNCLRKRRNEWAARAIQEFALAPRTWFGTLTLTPEWQTKFGALAAQTVKRRQREELEALPFDRQLHARHEAVGVEITKWFKRLRKAGHRFRYFIVLEAHESGLPHYHILLHEVGPPITKRALEASWPFGFTQWRLADDRKAIWYVAKYLGKSSAARVRASVNYGRRSSPLGLGASAHSEGEKHRGKLTPQPAP